MQLNYANLFIPENLNTIVNTLGTCMVPCSSEPLSPAARGAGMRALPEP